MTDLERVLAGELALATLPDPPALSLADLGPPTFEHPEAPAAWGHSFDNHLHHAEYLAPAVNPVADRCAPIERRVAEVLAAAGYTMERLTEADGRPWPSSVVTRIAIPAGSSILHVDDICDKATWKTGLRVPEACAEGYVQVAFFLWARVEGEARLVVYDRPFSPALLAERLDNAWQYPDSAVAGRATLEHRPAEGALIAFPCHLLHDVRGGAAPATWWAWSMYGLLAPGSRRVLTYG